MSNNLRDRILYIWVNVCRFILGCTFVFSGFVKAVDPIGSFYKISDYLSAFGFGGFFPDYILVLAAVFLSSFEFIIGINLLLAIRRRVTTFLLTVFMFFMTVLTLYLAIANPVSDCGCFGDAVKLSNWETFSKNIVLSILTFFVLRWYRFMFRVMTWRVQWIVSVYSVVFVAGISFYCLNHLPILDFRPYRIGTDIKESMTIPDNAEKAEYRTTFILEKDGKQREFTLEEYPNDSSWHFVDSKTVVVKKGYEPSISDFSISLLPDNIDITDSVLDYHGYTFLLVMPDIAKASDGNIDRINDIYDYSLDNGYKFYCLTSSSEEMINYWKEYMGAEYEFCMTDETTLKTMVRANPGLILIKDGVIINKWNHRHLPSDSDLYAPLDKISIGKVSLSNDFRTIIYVLILYVLPLALIIGVEAIWLKANKITEIDF